MFGMSSNGTPAVSRSGRFRRFLVTFTGASIIGLVAAAISHGDFETMKILVWIGPAGAIVLATAGALIEVFSDSSTGRLVSRLAVMVM